MFSVQQNRRRGRSRFCLEVELGGEMAQTMYTYVSKYKNYKIKGEEKKNAILDSDL
jgi:hypothetical protein